MRMVKKKSSFFTESVDDYSMLESIKFIGNIIRGPISAGLIGPVYNCYGSSKTLKLKSRLRIDTDLLALQMGKTKFVGVGG